MEETPIPPPRKYRKSSKNNVNKDSVENVYNNSDQGSICPSVVSVYPPRRACGDLVLISSSSGVCVNCEHDDDSEDNLNSSHNCKIIYVRSKKKVLHPLIYLKLKDKVAGVKGTEVQEVNIFLEDPENDHHYESLHTNDSSTDDYDSFESDSEFEHITYAQSDDIGNHRLPDPPIESSPYTFTRLATSAGKHMQRLRKNWFLTKNDLTKSLSRIAKKKSTSSLLEVPKKPPPVIEINIDELNSQSSPYTFPVLPIIKDLPKPLSKENEQNQASKSQSKFALYTPNPQRPSNSRFDKSEKTVKKKYSSLTSKLIRSFSMSGEMLANHAQENGNDCLEKPKSTFYLSEDAHDLHENLSERQCLSESQLIVDGKLINNQNSQSTPKLSPGKISKSQRTTWYTENQFQNEDKNSSACWYTKIDLYKNIPSKDIASSEKSENSGDSFMSCSTLSSTDNVNSTPTMKQFIPTTMFTIIPENENNLINEMKSADIEINLNEKHGEDMQKRLLEEPLYQFYNAAVVESGMRMLCSSSSWNEIDGYEQIGEVKAPTPPRPTAMELIKPSQHGHVRTLWCEVPEVIDSDLLNILNNHQKKLQEAKFELITSEASYLNSLNVLWNHFIMNLDQDHLLSKDDRSILLKNIGPVKEAAEQLLCDLEACWQNSILLHGVCDIIRKYAEEKFKAYVSYCENQVYIDQLLKKIKEIKGPLPDLLNELESSPVCQSLPFNSFVMLPMQRVTRYPLLIDAILKRLKPEDDEFDSCQLTLATLNKLVSDCNDGARRVAQQEEFLKTWSKLDFSNVGGEPSSSPADGSRLLIRSGEIVQLIARNDDIKHTFGKKFTKVQLHLFLFSDLLAITKTKNDNSYTVLQLCPRGFTEVNCGEYCKQFPVKDGAGKHLLFLTLLENHEGKTIEMLLSCGSESDKQRWYEAFSPPLSQDPDEILYESWDCPQVAALHSYTPTQPDEIALEIGDIVNVNKKMADGWYHGTRIRDGEGGWFPGNHVMEVASAHIRARNLKQRYRLLALSGNYLESQKNARS